MKYLVASRFALLFTLGTPAVAAPISFDEALAAILARDTEVARAASESEAVHALGTPKRLHFLPSITLDGTETKRDTNERTTSLLATAQANLFQFGAGWAALDASRAKEASARAKLRETWLDRERSAAQTLLEFIRLTREREILVSLEKMENETLAIAERQYAGGRIPIQEVQKVKIDLANVRARIGEAEVALSQARSQVITLLGHAEIRIEWPWKKKIAETKASNSLKAEDHLANRPDWIRSSNELEAQDRLAAQAFREMLPSLGASFSYGWTREHALGPDYARGWVGSVTLSIPLFNRFEQYANSQAQSAARKSTESLHEETKRRIRSEFETIPLRFENAKRTALDREDVLKISSSLYQDNLRRYRQGRASSNELNVDLNRFLETELNALNGWVAAHLALVDLAHLTGQAVSSGASSK